MPLGACPAQSCVLFLIFVNRTKYQPRRPCCTDEAAAPQRASWGTGRAIPAWAAVDSAYAAPWKGTIVECVLTPMPRRGWPPVRRLPVGGAALSAGFAAERHRYGRPWCDAAARDRGHRWSGLPPFCGRRSVLLAHHQIGSASRAHGLLDVRTHGSGVHDDRRARRRLVENRFQQHGPGQIGQDVRYRPHMPPAPAASVQRAPRIVAAPRDVGRLPGGESGLHRCRRVPVACGIHRG